MASNVVLRKAKGAARRLKQLGTRAGELRGDKKSRSIELWIDQPANDIHVMTNVLKVEGWAYSRTGSITRIAIYLDRHELGQLEYGLSRVDVMNAHNLQNDRCGFAGVVQLPNGVVAGSHTLRTVAIDSEGHTHTARTQITTTASGQAAAGMTYCIDAPAENVATGGRLEIAGWAFSPESPIRAVEALIDGNEIGTITHGVRRDDVFGFYPTPFARTSGFLGKIEIPDAHPGKHVLTLQFTTHNGAMAQVSRTVVVRPPEVAQFEVERADWRGDTLTIVGYALIPGKRLPWMVSAYRDGALLGTCRVKLSRPDLIYRFPDVPGVGKCGFELRCAMPAPLSDHPPSTATLTLQCADADGKIVKQEVMVAHRPDGIAQTIEACRNDLEDLVWQIRLRTLAEPTILNLSTDYPIETALKVCDVFTMPIKPEQTGADRANPTDVASTASMADIVVGLESDTQAALKQGTARYVTATLKPVKAGSKKGGQGASVIAEWNPQAELRPIPSVSIVIPAYNKIEYTGPCVERILETARPYIPLEVVVVDDCSTDATQEVITELARKDARVKYVRNASNSGFLLTSNHGAEVATGDVLIFLNNDTLPEPRWIEPLLLTLASQPHAGAVGGKLMYPDGTLQEAGGIIYNNGDAANFGRNSVDPEHPLFNTVREVDYVTGALLATPRKLFLELGLFDERYVPVYCEDSDYCFKVREAGQRVYYQPESSVVHFEGVTNGRDTNIGAKRYQVINTQKFHERWKDVLTRQGPPPDNYDRRTLNQIAVRYEREIDPVTGKHIPKRALVAFSSVPEFNHEGGSRQHAALIDFLLDLGWHVTILAVHKPGDQKYIRQLQQRGVQVYCGHRCLGAGDDYIEDFAQLARDGQYQLALMAPWYLTEESMVALRTFSPETRILTNTMDLHFLRDVRRALASADPGASSVSISPTIGVEMVRELSTYANSDLVTTVSAEETTMLRGFLHSHGHVEMLPHTEDIPLSPVPLAERHGMLFVGNFRHPPNAEAIEYLFSDVLPLIDPEVLRAHPITIIGTDMPDSLRTQARGLDGVRMLG